MEDYIINNRVCPMPLHWNELYNILVRETGNSDIQTPLILAAWNITEDEEKKQRFRYHLELIRRNDVNSAREFLNTLEEKDWYKG